MPGLWRILLLTDMREASRRLSQSLFDAYENGWAGEEDLGAIVEVSVISSENIKPTAAAALYHCYTFVFYKYKSSRTARGANLPLFIHN